MEITRDDVLNCARLACLSLQEEEIEPLRRDMERLLNQAERLDRLPLEGVEPCSHGISIPLACREDEIEASLTQAEALGNAPKTSAGHFSVPQVM